MWWVIEQLPGGCRHRGTSVLTSVQRAPAVLDLVEAGDRAHVVGAEVDEHRIRSPLGPVELVRRLSLKGA